MRNIQYILLTACILLASQIANAAELSDVVTAINQTNETLESIREALLWFISLMGLGVGILWGCYTWRLVVLGKNQSRLW